MQRHTPRLILLSIVAIVAVILLWARNSQSSAPPSSPAPGTIPKPADAVEISIIYAPEEEFYIVDAINDFNRMFAAGVNPLTGQPLAARERPIYVTGREGSSGTIHQAIVNAVIAPTVANVERPTIYAPASSLWLALVNYETGQAIFDLANSPPTAQTPVVIAIWESRLKAIQAKHGTQEIGWEELLAVMDAPKGWNDYGLPGRQTVYYGHTDPYISSTGLAVLIAEFTASAHYRAGQAAGERLSLATVNQPAVQQGVRDIEGMIKHYSKRTTEFVEYIAQGPTYVDFVPLQEGDLLRITMGQTAIKPPEPLVALYPKEGTLWLEHPFAVPNTDWVTPEQRAAARVFTDYILSEAIQKKVMATGLRPANPKVALGYPFVKELGVDPQPPAAVLDTPAPDVVAAVQASWQYVKKQADIVLVLDVSGSMAGDKLTQAQSAAQLFLDQLAPQNRVALVTFESTLQTVVPLGRFESNAGQMRQAIQTLQADGGTRLFDAVEAATASWAKMKLTAFGPFFSSPMARHR
ncbi:MAG: extracellular solute-binding protein [Caldilineaceae bacterium]